MPGILPHLAWPALAPAAICALWLTPVELIGCRNRGLAALAVVAASTLACVVSLAIAMRWKAQGRPHADRWLLTAVILTLPLALLIGPLG